MASIEEVPAFVIEEKGGRNRRVTLIGRGLPYRPLSLESEQRVKVTNPPGSPEGFGTVMGPTFGETSIDGFWKDKFIGTGATEQPPITVETPRSAASQARGALTGSQVGSAQEATQLFESLCAEGQLVEVTWGWVKRRGYLKKFSPKIHNIHDVEWSATFAWTSKAIPLASVEFGNLAGRIDSATGFRGLLDRIRQIADVPQTMMREYMDVYRSNIAKISSSVIDMEEAAAGLIEETSPVNEANRITSSLGGIVSAANDIVDTTESVGWAGLFENPRRALPFGSSYLASPVSSTNWDSYYARVLDSIDPVEILQARLYERETITDAKRIRDEAEARRRAMDAGPGYTLGTYRAREGEDLRDVSRLYYGTPMQWRPIMLFNGMDSIELYPGQTIAIPRLDPDAPQDV